MANYFNSKFIKRGSYEPVILDSYNEDSEIVQNTVYISTDDQPVKNTGAVHLNVKRETAVYPRDIIKDANKLSLSTNNSCFNNDDKYLALFKSVLTSFLADALENRFNFLLTSLPLRLDRKEPFYQLPYNFQTQSNLFINKGCGLYKNHQRFTFQPFEVWSETTEFYTYTINGYNLYIRIPEKDMIEDNCNIDDEEGDFRFEYYYLPDMPDSVNEPIHWLPPNPIIIEYLVGLMREKIDEKINYNFPEKQKLWKTIMGFATGQNNANSLKKLNKKHFIFKKF